MRINVQLPEFSGQDHEDPKNFIRECEDSFNAINTEMHTRPRLATRALKDDAAKCFVVFKNLNLTRVKFCKLLGNRYASPRTMMKLFRRCMDNRTGRRHRPLCRATAFARPTIFFRCSEATNCQDLDRIPSPVYKKVSALIDIRNSR